MIMPLTRGAMNISQAWRWAAPLLLGVMIVLSVHFSTTGEEYSISNRGWNGTSVFFDTVQEKGGTLITDLLSLNEYEDSLLLIVAPPGMPGEDSFDAYRKFLEQGNTIFIADESGASNVMLQGIGSSMRIVPENISSLDSAYESSFFPNGHPATTHPLLAEVEIVIFNRPAYVTKGDALLVSGFFSWEDLDGDGKMDAGEPSGTYAFLAREEIGEGEVIVCSDPSLLINAMQGGDVPGENRGFVDNLMGYRGTILVDSAASTATWDHAVLTGLRDAPLLQAGLLALLLFAAAFLWRKKTC